MACQPNKDQLQIMDLAEKFQSEFYDQDLPLGGLLKLIIQAIQIYSVQSIQKNESLKDSVDGTMLAVDEILATWLGRIQAHVPD